MEMTNTKTSRKGDAKDSSEGTAIAIIKALIVVACATAFLMACDETAELTIGNLIAQKTTAVVMLFGGRAIWKRL